MSAMPTLRQKRMSDHDGLWHRWERFTRHGLKVNGRRYTAAQLLKAWALILVALYILVWIGARVTRSKASLRLDSTAYIDEEFWRGRHLIFCVSPGRAGSKYLRNVFAVANNVVARHEPEPKMNGDVLRQVLLEGKRRETLEARAQIKLNAIRRALEGTAPDVAYVETSHMFIKTFSDVIVEKLGDLAKISIVFLRRPMKDTVLSQLRLGWFSKGHSGRDVWYYDPSTLHSSEQLISFKANASDPLELLFAYNADVLRRGMALENEIRSRHKQKQWINVRMSETLLMDISGDSATAGAVRLLSSIGMTADEEKLRLLHEQDRNARDIKKERFETDFTAGDVAVRLEEFKNKVPSLRHDIF